MNLSLKTFAQVSGIPQVTISRAYNAYKHVSERTRRKVMEAAERYGYQPNLFARGLATSRSGLVAFVLPNIQMPFYGEVIDQLELDVEKRGMSLLVFDSHFHSLREKRILHLIRCLRVEAVVLAPLTEGGRLVNRSTLAQLDMPVVFFDRFKGSGRSYVLLDNEKAGVLAADHLLSLGHRRVGMLEGYEDPRNICVRSRREGFLNKARSGGARLVRTWYDLRCDPGLFSLPEYGYKLVKSRLAEIRSSGITGLFVYTDDIALGAMRAFTENGYRIPQDISLIGCDDLDFAEYLTPPLTTIRQPKTELAAALCEAVTSGRRVIGRRIAPVLVNRGSCQFRGGK